MTRNTNSIRPGRKQVVFVVFGLVALYVLLPQFASFHHSIEALSDASLGWLTLAWLATVATYLLAAGTYWLLAIKNLGYWRTVLVQVASNFANKLLPAGIGGIGMNYAYLRKAKHDTTQAAAVVTANNLMGVIGHVLLTVLLLSIFHSQLHALHPAIKIGSPSWRYAIIIVLLAIVGILLGRYARRLANGVRAVFYQLLTYRKRPLRLLGAVGTSTCLTLCNLLSLYCCVHALHLNLPFLTVFLVFSLGIAIGTATPTPGGLGGAEAALVAGLVLYHVTAADALAAVLAYRFISYWFALLAGMISFGVIAKRDFFLFKV